MNTTHLAMWSGPRNISTAMLRSFESRGDCKVHDEPLYAHYLAATGLDHPGAEEIVRVHESDWRRVVAELCAPLSNGVALYYQKHMAHHLLPALGRDWLDRLDHAFLIRDPAAMLISLHKVTPGPRVEDTGLPQQLELYRSLREAGKRPPVIDSRDVLENPRALLTALCDRLGIEFKESMLAWAPGPRPTDGCWAPHWYDNVYASTGFGTPKPRTEELPGELESVLAACQPAYDELYNERLTAN